MRNLTISPITETGDDVNLTVPSERDYEPWCSSIRCAGDRYQVVLVKKENVKPKTWFCPECGSALMWKKIGSR